jgi:hypothetical protein
MIAKYRPPGELPGNRLKRLRTDPAVSGLIGDGKFYPRRRIRCNRGYSMRSDRTGSAFAARIACELTVTSENNQAAKPAAGNTHPGIVVW